MKFSDKSENLFDTLISFENFQPFMLNIKEKTQIISTYINFFKFEIIFF